MNYGNKYKSQRQLLFFFFLKLYTIEINKWNETISHTDFQRQRKMN